MKRSFKFIFTVLLALAVVDSFAQDKKLRGVVSGGQVRGIPIAIAPFKVPEGVVFDHQIDAVISDDLRASGKFEPIDSSQHLSRPSTAENVLYQEWRFIDAEALVIGEVWRIGDDNYEIQFRIFDVAREREISAGRIPNVQAKDIRKAAHIVSDEVYQAFTGNRGAFNSLIAFVNKTEVEFQRYRYRLMVADWDGWAAQEVYASWQPLLSPSWSPDGRKLAFVSFSSDGSIIQILDIHSGESEVVASFKGVNAAPSWSPDGTKLSYSSSKTGSADIYIYDLSTRQHTRLTSHYAIDTEPSWSPDGREILFTSNRTGRPQIYAYNLAAQSDTRQTFDGNENASANYGPRGEKMALVHNGGQIVLMDQQNKELTWITNGKFDESPSFSPNGDMVLYASEHNFEPAIMVASADGRIRTKLRLIQGDVREPAWSPLK